MEQDWKSDFNKGLLNNRKLTNVTIFIDKQKKRRTLAIRSIFFFSLLCFLEPLLLLGVSLTGQLRAGRYFEWYDSLMSRLLYIP